MVKTQSTAHGYSGKPLYQKLGMKPGMACLAVRAPEQYPALIDGNEAKISQAKSIRKADRDLDLVHLFCSTRADLEKSAEAALHALTPGGMLWVSWPKKSSSLFKDLTEDGVRAVVLPLGWVDVKVCAVDGDWSGLKFLKRKA